jgi:Fe-S cluster assembly iron-binding protein IscA
MGPGSRLQVRRHGCLASRSAAKESGCLGMQPNLVVNPIQQLQHCIYDADGAVIVVPI